MKRLMMIAWVGSLLLALMLAPTLAQDAEIKSEATYICEDGTVVKNFIEISVDAVDYTFGVYAHGLDGFDPVLALIDDGSADGDDAEACADGTFSTFERFPAYATNLPDIGETEPDVTDEWAGLSSSTEPSGPYRILVGSEAGDPGEVVLTFSIFTPEEYGESFFNDISLLLTPNVLGSKTPLSLYAFPYDYPSIDLDPMLEVLDPVTGDVLLACDTAGASTCYGNAETDLTDAYIGVGDGYIPSSSNSAALTLKPEDVAAIAETGESLTIRVSNYRISGDISFVTLALHVAIGEEKRLAVSD